MSHRVLVVEEPSLSVETAVSRLLTARSLFRCDQTNWDSFDPRSLSASSANLLLAVTTQQPTHALNFFHWLREHSVPVSTFAILPSHPEEELLKCAAETMDDFILSPIRTGELLHRLSRLLGSTDQEQELVRHRLSSELGLAQLVGSDPIFMRTIKKIPAIAASDTPVLISGETGTGKELCARAIHHLSKRADGPFVPVDCGAVPEHLFENEMFGHARGAFTDAHGNQKGLAAMAQGGTLFLDEVDSLSLAAQVKLLRFLEERTFKPLGAESFVRADVRLIAATNRDLESDVDAKQFRPDLFFRLSVLRIHLPPLRQRRTDVSLLARHFLQTLCESPTLAAKRLSAPALHKLESHNWPGNVRELFNILHRAAVTSAGVQILPSDLALPAPSQAGPSPFKSFRQARRYAIEKFERAYVEELLRKHCGNITRAAREAQKDRRAFGRLVKKYRIKSSSR